MPIIRHHVKFQYEIATRKYQTLLAKEQDKKEIQEGLIRACNVIDLIIEILRGSRNIKDAKACLTDGNTDHITFKNPSSKIMAQQLNFTDRQAQAILEMRLYKLIGLEIEALMKEHDETLENIAKYEDILEHRSSMAKVIIKELTAFKKAYGKERKTVIDNLKEAVVAAKKIEEQDVVFLMDRFGYAKIVDTSVYEVLNDVGTPAAIGSFRTLEIVGTISSYAANDREPAAVLHGVLRIPFSRLNFCKTQTTALGQCLLLFRSQVVP